MSEFRIFCIGGFLGSGLVAAAGNRGMTMADGTAWEQILAAAFLCGCVAVTIFGRRAA